ESLLGFYCERFGRCRALMKLDRPGAAGAVGKIKQNRVSMLLYCSKPTERSQNLRFGQHEHICVIGVFAENSIGGDFNSMFRPVGTQALSQRLELGNLPLDS